MNIFTHENQQKQIHPKVKNPSSARHCAVCESLAVCNLCHQEGLGLSRVGRFQDRSLRAGREIKGSRYSIDHTPGINVKLMLLWKDKHIRTNPFDGISWWFLRCVHPSLKSELGSSGFSRSRRTQSQTTLSSTKRTEAARRPSITAGWWWLEHDFYEFPYIWNVIIPIDELIFFRGIETSNQTAFGWPAEAKLL